jgi:hypothetical protein
MVLSSGYGTVNLNGIAEDGFGAQVLSGVSGMGLPPISAQWNEGAGNGATYRGGRILSRDLDLPIDFYGRDRTDLKDILRNFALVVQGGCRLVFIEDSGTDSWYLDVHLIGGGDVIYGQDTIGRRELNTVVTFRSGKPLWTKEQVQTHVIRQDSGSADPFLPDFMSMPLASSQALGDIQFENIGDAPAYPTWIVHGPYDDFTFTSAEGEFFTREVAATNTEVTRIDTELGVPVEWDESTPNTIDTINLYFTPVPKYWTVPPGLSSANITISNATSETYVICSWSPRKWVVV